MNVEVITIDNQVYMIIKELKKENINYIYLSNMNDEKDILIKKITDDNPNYLLSLDSSEEFQKALLLFLNDQFPSD